METTNNTTPQNNELVQKTIFSILFSISFAHLLNDLIQAIIPSVYPILKQNYGLTFTQIGLITFSFQLTASVFQPFVGYYTDKYPKPFSQVYGMIFSSLGIISLSYAFIHITNTLALQSRVSQTRRYINIATRVSASRRDVLRSNVAIISVGIGTTNVCSKASFANAIAGYGG